MNLLRIDELKNLIARLYGALEKLKVRRENLKKEVLTAKEAQDRLEDAVATAQERVEVLSSLGLRAEFLEEIIRPVRNRPDCSGIGTVVENEISDIDCQITETNGEIRWANEEKKQLEAEGEVCMT